ncbi:MAG: manganese efflux pump, partial [Candidatus Zixiibacteriota bacterium]
MSTFEIIFIAIGLAMDAFAVSVTCGATNSPKKLYNALKASFSFGFFQAAMPIAGWAAGLALRDIITELDHWVAFSLLAAIGTKMIYDSIKDGASSDRCRLLNTTTLLALSLATSIDALIVGVGFAFLNVPIVTAIVLIGVITMALSLSGFFLGERFARILGGKVEIVGGLILIGIGTKILIEHLAF